jgi:hypothetical protein
MQQEIMRTLRVLSLPVLAIAFVIGLAPAARAGEDVTASVSASAAPTPIVTLNGNPYANGSYAVGTLRLEYTYVGMQFPTGYFGTFDLDLALRSSAGPATSYPTDLTLRQVGSTNLDLAIVPSEHSVTGAAWTGSSEVEIYIAASAAALTADGSTIVANLQLQAPGRDHLGTTTTVQVKITLVHPTSCMRHYTFISDRENENAVLTMALRYGTRGGNTNKITNVSPSQVNHNVLLVNVCSSDETLDLRMQRDPRFTWGPGGAPANAVFIYSTAGQLVPGPINVATLTAGPVLGKVADILNLTVPAGHTVLVKAHLKLDPDLDRFGVGASPFTFRSFAYEPGNSWTAEHGPTTPNPAVAAVPFSLTPQN